MRVTISQIQWVNNNLEITPYLEELGVNIPFNKKIFCPFHANYNTPAAKVFDYGVQSVYCFVCRKHYHVYDVMVKNGYSVDAIRSLVPKEYWYNLGEQPEEDNELKFPIVSDSMRGTYDGNVKDFMKQLEIMLDNVESVPNFVLR